MWLTAQSRRRGKERRVADFLITDVKLPEGIDGWQIAERFREDDSKRPVICAIFSSPSRPRLADRGRLQRRQTDPETRRCARGQRERPV